MKKLLYLLFLIPVYAYPEDYQVFSVHGKVVNTADNQPVEMAAVQLYKLSQSGDSSMLTGVQADLQGDYWLTSVPKGTYKIWVSSIGFKPMSRRIDVTDNTTVPTIKLVEDVALLSEVEVKGKAAEMTVKGDTIEYNTAAYHVQENAMVEDLLKKMNGVEVDKEGNVKVNGEDIKAVRIDGKKFFGSDVQSATKNIPAEMIDKIQVIDEKSDMAKLTGFEDEDTERIINLTLKANRKIGVFGNYNGGIGADMVTDNGKWFDYNKNFFNEDFRYTAGIFTNVLLGESQTTIIGSANNTNEIKTGRGRGWMGGQNAGITASENLGVNTNVDFTNKIEKKDSQSSMLFGGNASMNHSRNNTYSESNKDSYSGPLTYVNHNNDTTRSQVWDVKGRFELDYQIDTLNKLMLFPEISYTNTRKVDQQKYIYRRDSTNTQELVNNGMQDRNTNSEEIGANLKLIYNRKFLKPGRSLTLDVRADFTNTKDFSDTYSYDYIREKATVNQNNTTTANALNTQARISWVEPIASKNHFLETQIRFGTNLRNSIKDQYNFTNEARTESTYDDSLSNKIKNVFFQEAISLSYRYIQKNTDLTIGAQFNPSQTISQTRYGQTIQDTTIYAWNWSPTIRFRYNFGKKEFARIFYRGRNQQPTIQQMVPVRNNSNAMNETVGNLALKPAFSHNMHAMYSKFEQEKFWSLMTGLHLTVTQDALVNNSIYDNTGKLYQQTVNAQGTPWNLWGDLMFNTPFANKLLQFNTRTSIGYQEQLMYIQHEVDADKMKEYIAKGETLGLGAESKTGKLNISENLTLRFTHEIVDLGVTGSIRYVRSANNLNASSLSNVIDWSVTGDVLFHLPKSWNISADCGYTGRYGYNLDDVNEILLNAAIDKSWGNATLSLKAYDLLHQKKNIIQTVGENSVSYQKSNALPTYFMLTFTYKFNKMGDMKASGMGGYMQEMIESGADPSKGKMPQGPPPFMR